MFRFSIPAFLGLGLALAALSTFAAEPAIEPATTVTNSLRMQLKRIPAGSLTTRVTDEDFIFTPVSTEFGIKVEKAFYLGVYEVTQEEYEKVMGKNPSAFSPVGYHAYRVKGMDTKRFPVENVTWAMAREFCTKLSEMPEEKKAGRAYRLPTGDEWEYAARAGSSKNVLFAFGATLTGEQANFNGTVPYGVTGKTPNLERTTAVGSYKPNAWGLYDMHGNVWEWTADDFRTKEGREVGGYKMLRGGSWLNRGRDCAASTRLGLAADEVFNNVGFRVVCDVVK
jgi:formylglycine-generating enzyme required for sulfatase activity